MTVQVKQFAYLDNQTIMAGASLWGGDPVTVEDLDTRDHPNAMPFKGVLLRVDEASNKPPGGAQGHLIMVPKVVAERLLPTLVGMGINYSSDFDHHEPQKKIGVITSAWLDGRDVKVKGIIYERDFPGAAKAIRAKSSTLGMSMELADIWVEDRNSRIWKLDDFAFTGGTILSKSAAAYHRTSLAASGLKRYYVQALAAAGVVVEGKLPKGERKMAKKIASSSNLTEDRRKSILKAMAAAAAAGVSANLGGTLARMEKTMASQTFVLKSLLAAVKTLPKPKSLVKDSSGFDVSAAAAEEEEERIAAAKKKDASADDDPSGEDVSAAAAADEDLIEAEGDEEDELLAAKKDASSADPSGTDVSAAAEDEDELSAFDSGDEHGESDASDEEPGEVNKVAMKHAKENAKKGVSASGDHRLNRAIRALSAASHVVEKTNRKFEVLSHDNKKLRKRVAVMQAQVEAAARRTSRATLPPEAYALLSKGGINVPELQASGQKLSVAQVDKVLRADPNLRLDPATMMGVKNALVQHGLMDEGLMSPNN